MNKNILPWAKEIAETHKENYNSWPRGVNIGRFIFRHDISINIIDMIINESIKYREKQIPHKECDYNISVV